MWTPNIYPLDKISFTSGWNLPIVLIQLPKHIPKLCR